MNQDSGGQHWPSSGKKAAREHDGVVDYEKSQYYSYCPGEA